MRGHGILTIVHDEQIVVERIDGNSVDDRRAEPHDDRVPCRVGEQSVIVFCNDPYGPRSRFQAAELSVSRCLNCPLS